jgi:hypothetical protein
VDSKNTNVSVRGLLFAAAFSFILGLAACQLSPVTTTLSAPSIALSDITTTTSAFISLSSQPGASILYSLDGSTPTRQYTGPIPVYGPAGPTVKAVASVSGQQSDVTVRTFTNIRPFSFDATVDPAPHRYVDFNGLSFAAWWENERTLHVIFTTGSILDGKPWTCTIGSAPAIHADSAQGSVVFSWQSSPRKDSSKVTAQISVGQWESDVVVSYVEINSARIQINR